MILRARVLAQVLRVFLCPQVPGHGGCLGFALERLTSVVSD